MQWLIETYPDAVEFLPLDDLFPQAERALTPEGFLHVFPQIYDCEGFFVARLRKTAAIPALPAPKYKVGNFPFSPLKDANLRLSRKPRALVDCSGKIICACGSAIKRSGCSRLKLNL